MNFLFQPFFGGKMLRKTGNWIDDSNLSGGKNYLKIFWLTVFMGGGGGVKEMFQV